MSLRVERLTKTFGGVRALDAVDLEIRPGQVHALLGHNGAGKSSLIKCVAGAYPPDSGTIEIGGVSHSRLTPRTSLAAGVAIIFQQLSLIPSLSVADNVFLGQERTRGGLLRRHDQIAATEEVLAQVGAHCRPTDRVADLTTGQRQLVEIAKALRKGVSVLILDEPTAALAQAEANLLAERVEDLAAQGIAICYVTHLLGEVERLADEVTVLRDGRVDFHAPMRDLKRADLVRAITGGTTERRAGPAVVDAPVALRLDQVRAERLGPIDLEVHRGEIVGLFGQLGSGRTRLLDTVMGRRSPTGGAMQADGRALRARGPAAAIRQGVAMVPADRGRAGVLARMSAHDNVLLPAFGALSRLGLRGRRAEHREFSEIGRRVDLRPNQPRLPASSFSGGNQQKLVLGRWVGTASTPRVLLLDEPTQGVDVGARGEIYQLIDRLAADGMAVVVASSDPEEIVALCQRCVVMSHGTAIAELAGDEITEERILALAHHGEEDHSRDDAGTHDDTEDAR